MKYDALTIKIKKQEEKWKKEKLRTESKNL